METTGEPTDSDPMDALLRMGALADPSVGAEVDDGEIADWRAGRLGPEQQRAFEDRMAAEPELRELVRGQLLADSAALSWPTEEEDTGGEVVRGPWGVPRAILGAAVAAAAAVALWVGRPPADDSVAGFYPYSIRQIQGGTASVRGGDEPQVAPARVVRLARDGVLRIALSPGRAQKAPPARVLVGRPGEPSRAATDATWESVDGGGLLLELPVERSLPGAGRWQLQIQLGPDCPVPEPGGGCQSIEVVVDVVEGDPAP